jgi:hypothetical protein
MWGVYHDQPGYGLIESTTAHDRDIAEAARDDYVAHRLIPASAFVAPVGTVTDSERTS